MKIHVVSTFDARDIVERCGMGPDNYLRRYFAGRVRAYCDPYVPMQSGMLKKTSYVTHEGDMIIYDQPYARIHYYGEVMGPNVLTKKGWRSMAKKGGKKLTGREFKYNGAPMRGNKWDQRMLEERKGDLEKDLQAYITRRLKRRESR